MKPEVFDELVNDIHLYFSRKHPERQQKDLWFEEVSYIPDIAVKEIYRHVIRAEKPPTNLPMAIKAGWEEWRKLNPAKVMNYQVTNCPACGSMGLIFYRKKEKPKGGFRYEYCARCPDCENWKRHYNEKPIAKDREELELNGYEVWPYVRNGALHTARMTSKALSRKQECL